MVMAAAMAIAALIGPAAGVAAAAEPSAQTGEDLVFIGSKEGYGGTGLFPVYSGSSAAGEPDFWAYCIEHGVHAVSDVDAQTTDADAYLGSNYFTDPAVQSKVQWVLAHSYPAVSLEQLAATVGLTGGLARNDAIEATQYAIWRYTDVGQDMDNWQFANDSSRAVYAYLQSGANAGSDVTQQDLALAVGAPTLPQTAGALVGPFTLTTNQPSARVFTEPSLRLTDGQGNPIDEQKIVDGQQFYLDLRGGTSAGSATVTAAVSGSNATGRVISVPTAAGSTPTADDHAQSLILVAASTASTQTVADVAWSAKPAEPSTDDGGKTPDTEQPSTEQPDTEQPDTEQPSTDAPVDDQSNADQMVDADATAGQSARLASTGGDAPG